MTTDRSQPAYFSKYPTVRFERSHDGILVMSLHKNGGPLTFTAQDHESLVDAFYDVSRDRDNKIVILTGAGGDFIPSIDFQSFGDVSDPDVWSKVHDEGTQILENIANVRVPMIWALEGKAHVHAEYGLLANVIVAGEDASFNDLPHFAEATAKNGLRFDNRHCWLCRFANGRIVEVRAYLDSALVARLFEENPI